MKPLFAAAAACVAFATPVLAQTAPSVATALADPARPQADKDRDAARHPAEILAFVGVEPGAKVGDYFMGGGYWTRILAVAVGPKGHVHGFQPAEFARPPKPGDAPLSAVYPNVTIVQTPAADVAFAEPLDAILTFENWHDLHSPRFTTPDFSKVSAKRLYDALKPGGVLLVADHVAAVGTADAPNTLHRIDPAKARAEIESAGFKFEAALPVLANPADPHTANVFAPEIRGKTDQFVYRFRKP
ncbi:class I SAM-dependent methyltransferase [Sphingomonas hengshuiensis]|uniref:Methyltransferase n=1 Tax=Sphingomonas hengshuiensis TaxID=1609977 RepID=A0A7U4J6B6_9SPHN|nr:class I SAM-dependent methyltransferase [Sphingomonas hengshuiensis]AJP71058.1 hypothetical protein TS85_03315 [Sphingomonas hengshuiensis]